jgi:cell wall-associated NlpC family hydrolase
LKKQLATLLLATTLTSGIGLLAPTQADAASAVIVSSVNFRSGASVDSNSKRFLKAGETVEILSKVNDYWYKVRDSKNVVGYVSTSSQYIKTSSSGGSGSGSGSGGSSSTRNAIIEAGKKYLGTPYEFGSDRSNTRTFDCSDFVRQAFKDGAKINLPSDSRQQGQYVRDKGQAKTNWKNLKAGDLMFFMDYKGTSASAYPSNTSNQRITHVGIYLGDGKILHTYSKDSGGVRIDSIDNRHWEYRFIFGGSAL